MTEEVDTIPVEEVRRENFAESPNQRLDDERGNSSEPPAEHREEEMHGEEARLEIQGNEERENMEISVDEVAGPKDQQASISGFNHSYEEGSWDGQGSEEVRREIFAESPNIWLHSGYFLSRNIRNLPLWYLFTGYHIERAY